MRFEKVSMEKNFYFLGVENIEIEKTSFLKINVLDTSTNTTFSIYKKYTEEDSDILFDMTMFEDIDDKIFVVYKNGRLKFDMRTQA